MEKEPIHIHPFDLYQVINTTVSTSTSPVDVIDDKASGVTTFDGKSYIPDTTIEPTTEAGKQMLSDLRLKLVNYLSSLPIAFLP